MAYLIVCRLSLRHFHALPSPDDNMHEDIRKAVMAVNIFGDKSR
jgi:hypothetical protein